MAMKEVIFLVMMGCIYLGLKRPAAIIFTIMDKVLLVVGELDIGLRPYPPPPIIYLSLVDHSVYLYVVMREVDIGLRPYTFLHITMADYIFSTQGSLKNLFQGVCKEKLFKTIIKVYSHIHDKIILIILIQEFQHTLIQS